MFGLLRTTFLGVFELPQPLPALLPSPFGPRAEPVVHMLQKPFLSLPFPADHPPLVVARHVVGMRGNYYL